MKRLSINGLAGFIILAVGILSCKQPSQKNSSVVAVQTGLTLDERLNALDSMVVVFYNDPFGPDSLRYTRFYKQLSLTDTMNIQALKQQLQKTFDGPKERVNCRGEGKIWCFSKGKIFQTLYFSTQCDDCCFIYLIKDGNFYYSKTDEAFMRWLFSIKPMAAEPVVSDGQS